MQQPHIIDGRTIERIKQNHVEDIQIKPDLGQCNSAQDVKSK